MTIEIKQLSDIHAAARDFISQTEGHSVFAFYGRMGAGKTTFIKALCEELGVKEPVSSPSFAIVNEYRDGNGKPVYHFDFYRINKIEEAFDFGYEDYFYSDSRCFIEWPELVETLLPENTVKVSINETPSGSRLVEWNKLD
ncbi:MAG: tRNA (adenosine(37)-N6)-threonylcarbamoyltransferase complex ATPase subunit type 1 TsaE [Dysgonamonadaceae bacterium]|jgi:tRNA threonylcarbamoyladenosine biosynthesis protein TsaE|nr:tRNA (adenosine(37)-N6)-threonylcarbamoyltransferase complex ATPase subunit type 1 TsaE [Dysgonamonadaceae bacterium]